MLTVLLELLYAKPTTTTAALARRLSISQPTADRTLADLRKLGIIHELTGQRRNRVFYFKDYHQLFQS